MSWIGVDFDGTLAEYHGWQGTKLGRPIWVMVDRVKAWLDMGKEVRIVTARVASRNKPENLLPSEEQWDANAHRAAIEDWCVTNIGFKLPITAEKDFAMETLWDDRCVTVEKNTGKIMSVGVY